MSAHVEGHSLGAEFKGCVFQIAGGNDKQGFPMKPFNCSSPGSYDQIVVEFQAHFHSPHYKPQGQAPFPNSWATAAAGTTAAATATATAAATATATAGATATATAGAAAGATAGAAAAATATTTAGAAIGTTAGTTAGAATQQQGSTAGGGTDPSETPNNMAAMASLMSSVEADLRCVTCGYSRKKKEI